MSRTVRYPQQDALIVLNRSDAGTAERNLALWSLDVIRALGAAPKVTRRKALAVVKRQPVGVYERTVADALMAILDATEEAE